MHARTPRRLALALTTFALALAATGCGTGTSPAGPGVQPVADPATAAAMAATATPRPSLAQTVATRPTAAKTAGAAQAPGTVPAVAVAAGQASTPATGHATNPVPATLPATVRLDPMTHAYQTWNNCAAVSTSMVLSYYGVTRTQAELLPIFRTNVNDKHVEPRQLVTFFPNYDLNTLLIEGGTVERVKQLVAAGIPVVTPQWLDHKPDAIGHYRVVRGYDDARGGFIVNDSMTGPDQLYAYDDFVWLWRGFNFRYLPVYRPVDEPAVLAILGSDADRQQNLQRALATFIELAQKDPNDAMLRFSIGTSFFELGNYPEAIAAYERAAQLGLPPKMLWYQFWPVVAYNNVGNARRALQLASEQIATAGVFGEMRYERGRAFEATGNLNAAVADYYKAIEDDANLTGPREALKRLGRPTP